MKPYTALNFLVPLVALAALVATLGGLFWPGGDGPVAFTTLHGQSVQLDGRGLYRADTLFTAGSFRGTDVVTLLVFIPLLLLAWVSAGRGSARGHLALLGLLGYFLYTAVSMAFGAAYNDFFLVYVIYLAASFFAFGLAFAAIDLSALPARLSPRLPHRGTAIFLFVAGLAPLVLWLGDVLGALAQARVPEMLGPYTTVFTYAVDLGLIVPIVYFGGWLLWRRSPLGYVLSVVMLVLLAGIGLAVVGQTAAQLQAGVTFTPGMLVGFVGSWIVLAIIALAFLIRLFRCLDARAVPQPYGLPAHAQR